MSIDLPNPRNYTINGDELEDIGGKDLWHERFWETLDHNDFMFQFAIDNGDTSASQRCLHLPDGWPDPDEFDREPFEKTHDHPNCPRNLGVQRWTFKPVSCFPVGYLEVCSSCMYTFAEWWQSHETEGESLGRDLRPPHLIHE